jgi:hypothetical protein
MINAGKMYLNLSASYYIENVFSGFLTVAYFCHKIRNKLVVFP